MISPDAKGPEPGDRKLESAPGPGKPESSRQSAPPLVVGRAGPAISDEEGPGGTPPGSSPQSPSACAEALSRGVYRVPSQSGATPLGMRFSVAEMDAIRANFAAQTGAHAALERIYRGRQ